ncbi:hypothetical protein CTI12_AA494820 [Artemisia annua]|uniref:Uncharacterized protein n=1 Tax=Artemisia annua TaxID=35608 RepID=A0A2U1LEQ5_ARTAN|nr:hypothetical protein CTI12_AA494820 [Artemisia annua]
MCRASYWLCINGVQVLFSSSLPRILICIVDKGNLIPCFEFCYELQRYYPGSSVHVPRRLVAPQVNRLLQVAHKCQSTIAETGCDGVSQQDLQTNSNMVVTPGR